MIRPTACALAAMALVVAASSAMPTAPVQAQGSLGRIGDACARSAAAAREHLAAGGRYTTLWGPLPQPGRQTTQLCACAQQAFRDAGTARMNILAITLFESNRGELFTTNILDRRARRGMLREGVGYRNDGNESADTRAAYADFRQSLYRCGVAAVGDGHTNLFFGVVPHMEGVEITDGSDFR